MIMEKRKTQLVLDSAYFTVLHLLTSEVVDVLKNKAGLNVMQYRVLLELYSLTEESMHVGEIAAHLGAQPNVVTQAANELERFGLARRMADTRDARARFLEITSLGLARIELIDKMLNEEIYAVWGTFDEKSMCLLKEAIIIVGVRVGLRQAQRDVALHKDDSGGTAISSQYLTALFATEQGVSNALKTHTGLSYNDCRILLLLGEFGGPMRSKLIARTLCVKPNTVTRAADRLVRAGLVNRLGDPGNTQAVLIGVTDEGAAVQRQIVALIDEYATTYVFGCLDAEHAEVVNNVAQEVLSRILGDSE